MGNRESSTRSVIKSIWCTLILVFQKDGLSSHKTGTTVIGVQVV